MKNSGSYTRAITVVKERNIYPMTNWSPPVSTSSFAKRKTLKTIWRHIQCELLHQYGTFSQSDRLIEVKTIKKNSSLGPQKRWPRPRPRPRPRPLNTGVRSMQVSFTVIKGNDFRDFVKWPLNRGPLNTGVTVLSMLIFCFSLQYSILGVALSNRYCQFS